MGFFTVDAITNRAIMKHKRLSTVKGTSTQSGWGTTVDINGDTHRIVYCYEENVLKIIEYGFFDKTASMFKSEDADKELRLAS
jgi:hypothetical protein